MVRGRQRKKKQQRQQAEQLQQEQCEAPQDDNSSRGSGLSEPLLQDPHRVYDDTRIAAVAVKKRWDIPEDKRRGLIERLFGIVDRKSNVILTKAGPFDSKSDADKNAIAAGKVIVAMEGQNQTDDKPAKETAGTQVNVNVGVQVNQSIQSAVTAEPEYLEWLRQRELAEGGNADAVGANGFAAAIPDSAPRLGFGPGRNGHDSGN